MRHKNDSRPTDPLEEILDRNGKPQYVTVHTDPYAFAPNLPANHPVNLVTGKSPEELEELISQTRRDLRQAQTDREPSPVPFL